MCGFGSHTAWRFPAISRMFVPRPDLLPTVQSRSHYELVDLQFQLEGRGKPNRPYQIFGEHFAVGLVYDLPEA